MRQNHGLVLVSERLARAPRGLPRIPLFSCFGATAGWNLFLLPVEVGMFRFSKICGFVHHLTGGTDTVV